jgi:hypothetical protein
MYKLSNQGTKVIRLFDNAHIPVDTNNKDYIEYLEWIESGNIALPANDKPSAKEDLKLKGFEYNGVMCSAKKADQDGLFFIWSNFILCTEDFEPTEFSFVNGGKLVLDSSNIEDFYRKWKAFRKSFFVP